MKINNNAKYICLIKLNELKIQNLSYPKHTVSGCLNGFKVTPKWLLPRLQKLSLKRSTKRKVPQPSKKLQLFVRIEFGCNYNNEGNTHICHQIRAIIFVLLYIFFEFTFTVLCNVNLYIGIPKFYYTKVVEARFQVCNYFKLYEMVLCSFLMKTKQSSLLLDIIYYPSKGAPLNHEN